MHHFGLCRSASPLVDSKKVSTAQASLTGVGTVYADYAPPSVSGLNDLEPSTLCHLHAICYIVYIYIQKICICIYIYIYIHRLGTLEDSFGWSHVIIAC